MNGYNDIGKVFFLCLAFAATMALWNIADSLQVIASPPSEVQCEHQSR